MINTLIPESLALMLTDSIEGASKCYDKLAVARTTLLDKIDEKLLDSNTSVNTKPTSASENNLPSKSNAKAAVLPLLITNLSKISGEVLLFLARLRGLCGTWRYRRRFMQIIVPVLVRPLCSDLVSKASKLDAIIEATELLLDEAQELFSYGWYERDTQLINDDRRAEFLKDAVR